MRFYNRQHRHYCRIDLHVKTMYVRILDAAGQVLVHRNVKSSPEPFLETGRRAERTSSWRLSAAPTVSVAAGVQFGLNPVRALSSSGLAKESQELKRADPSPD
jgi:hypothetical protein